MEKRIVWTIDDDMVSQFATNYRIYQSFKNCQVICHSGPLEGLAFLRECQYKNRRLPDILLIGSCYARHGRLVILDGAEKNGGSGKKNRGLPSFRI